MRRLSRSYVDQSSQINLFNSPEGFFISDDFSTSETFIPYPELSLFILGYRQAQQNKTLSIIRAAAGSWVWQLSTDDDDNSCWQLTVRGSAASRGKMLCASIDLWQSLIEDILHFNAVRDMMGKVGKASEIRPLAKQLFEPRASLCYPI